MNQNAHWASPSLASGRPTILGSTSQQSPVASSVPPPTIITCVFERSRTRWPAYPVRARYSASHGKFLTAMWMLPRTRKSPPATKYFAVFGSCEWSSSSGYGSSRRGGARPGTNLKIAVITTPKNAT